ncbi:hypothetical protein [Caulobacter sp. CCH5-E12]|uniref:hypothetical protein n=1 Tax=Caulobacter sp. CCH5-E12 TaxID=1768770 RepID=UPI0007807D6C|nr:hypothetical protein [Caulobacter sp. CCH5-E12]
MPPPWNKKQLPEAERFTLALVETCVRNTQLETLHAGRSPVSASGDFSDVKVVDAEGEIPWTEISRISDDEMKALMIEIVDRVFTFLSFPEDLIRLGAAGGWDRPKLDAFLMRTVEARKAIRDGADPAKIYGDPSRFSDQ